jgi:dTDP-glucose 4,6-dehydratase
MQNILVTGGCGFIGTNFIRALLRQPDFKGRIINVDKLTYAGNPENLVDVEDNFEERYFLVRADICDRQTMADLFSEYSIDAVCNFAAESHVDRSIVAPDDFINTNIYGTFNLLETAREFHDQIVRFHHVSTDEVFGSLGKEGYFTEETAYQPSSPYSASKAASDHLIRAYHTTYDLPVSISNCSNNYGPYQFPEKLIPLIILNALEGKSLPVYGRGENIRDWLYVTDHCKAVWEIMQKGKPGETYNIGGRCELANLDTVRAICDVLDEIRPSKNGRPHRDLIEFVKDRPGHDFRYAIDCAKLEKELGWKPRETFETGIRKTIQWYLDNPGWIERVKSGDYMTWVEQHYGDSQAG